MCSDELSPIDQTALSHWAEYSSVRDAMLEQTHHSHSPWIVVNVDDKKCARLNVIRDLARRVDCPDKEFDLPQSVQRSCSLTTACVSSSDAGQLRLGSN